MTSTQKTVLQTTLILVGVLVAQDVMAMTDGTTLNQAWTDSKLESFITKDLKRIGSLAGLGVACIMAVLPKTPKAETIGGAFIGIAGTGFLMDWVAKTYTVLI